MRPNFVCPLFVLALSWLQVVLQADTPNDWLRGVGNQLEMRLRGEVLDAAGGPANGIVVSGSIYSPEGFHAIDTKVDGNRFEVWFPLNQRILYSALFKASLNGDEQFAFKSLNAFELRQAAIDGIKLSLQVPSRQVNLKVTDSGKPVSGANLIAQLEYGTELRSKSDENGIVRLKLLPAQTLKGVTAWTDDFRIGGYGFDGKLARDPDKDEHVIDLSPCRNLKMRFVDQSGTAVPDVSFVLHVATPLPNLNYMGQTDHTRLKTDANGEALYRWFPDWTAHHFYAESKSDLWYVDRDKEVQDDVVVFKLTRSKIADRKRIAGSVRSSATDVGGFFVSVQSFQADRKRHSDQLSVFTNADGTFSVEVLPDATYCVYSIDRKWVSNITDLIPYQSAADKITNPDLTLSKGQQVDVFVTTGPDRKPFRNLEIGFHTEYLYSWFEGGKKRTGMGGPGWRATTNAAGRIQTPANLGKLNVSVYTPLWQTRESHEVGLGQPLRITLHREIEAKRKLHGQLILEDGLDAKLDDAAITISAIGGSSKDNQTLRSDSKGAFSFETLASPVGVFACTKEGRAAGMIVLTDQEGPAKLTLRRTLDFSGQLIGNDGKPSVGVKVVATARVEGKKDNEDNFFVATGFDVMSLEAITDQQGKYTIVGVPAELKVSLRAVLSSAPGKSKYFGEVRMEENESRPTMVNRIGAANPSAATLASRFEKNLRDSKLLGFPLMVILSDESKSVAEFVNANFVDYESKPEVASYLQFVVPRDKASLNESDADFFKERNWQIPVEGRVFACVFNAMGAEEGRLEVDVTEKESVEKVAAFVSKYLPSKFDAEKNWEKAFEDAKRTNRKVWARIGGRYCGPCFLLARWLDDHREILAKDFVMLKIDDYADENGVSIARRITRGGSFGIPFFAIFDKEQLLVVDSESPLGNIGFPSGYEGSKHLRKMLLASRGSLTDAEVEQLVASLADE